MKTQQVYKCKLYLNTSYIKLASIKGSVKPKSSVSNPEKFNTPGPKVVVKIK